MVPCRRFEVRGGLFTAVIVVMVSVMMRLARVRKSKNLEYSCVLC